MNLEAFRKGMDGALLSFANFAWDIGLRVVILLRFLGIEAVYWVSFTSSWLLRAFLILTPILVFLALLWWMIFFSLYTAGIAALLILFIVVSIVATLAELPFLKIKPPMKRTANSRVHLSKENLFSKLIDKIGGFLPKQFQTNNQSANTTLAVVVLLFYALALYNFLSYKTQYLLKSGGFELVGIFHNWIVEITIGNLLALFSYSWTLIHQFYGGVDALELEKGPDELFRDAEVIAANLTLLLITGLVAYAFYKVLSKNGWRRKQPGIAVGERNFPIIGKDFPLNYVSTMIPMTSYGKKSNKRAHVSVPGIYQNLQPYLAGAGHNITYKEFVKILEDTSSYTVFRDEHGTCWVHR